MNSEVMEKAKLYDICKTCPSAHICTVKGTSKNCEEDAKRVIEVQQSKQSVMQAALQVCKLWAALRSKDPATKVGACIVDPYTGGLFMGYNGFPAGVLDETDIWLRRTDDPEKTGAWSLTKYDLVIHAEVNAARKALLGRVHMKHAALVCSHPICPECMKTVVLANGAGDLIRAINKQKTTTIPEFETATKNISLAQGIMFDINRGGNLIYKTYMEK